MATMALKPSSPTGLPIIGRWVSTLSAAKLRRLGTLAGKVHESAMCQFVQLERTGRGIVDGQMVGHLAPNIVTNTKSEMRVNPRSGRPSLIGLVVANELAETDFAASGGPIYGWIQIAVCGHRIEPPASAPAVSGGDGVIISTVNALGAAKTAASANAVDPRVKMITQAKWRGKADMVVLPDGQWEFI